MGKGVKILVFIIVCLVILTVLSLLKESGAGAVMWLGVLAIPFIYKSLFSENKTVYKQNDDDFTLRK